MYLPPTGPPPLPAEPTTPAHISPYLDPNSPKYSVPGIVFFAGLVGLILLICLIRCLWRNRASLAESLAARGASVAMWFESLPLPATACLCGLFPATTSPPTRLTSLYPCPPPPYEDPSPTSVAPALPVMPPGLPPPGNSLTDDLGAAPAQHTHSRLPPPVYPPPPPPPTPESEPPESVAAASSDAPVSAPRGPPPTYSYPPAPLAIAQARGAVAFARTPPSSGPTTSYSLPYRVPGASEDLDEA